MLVSATLGFCIAGTRHMLEDANLFSSAVDVNDPWLTPHGKPGLPSPGAGLRDITEGFSANPSTGVGSSSIGIAASAGRSKVDPAVGLSYSSAGGNGPFGLGWTRTRGR